LGYFSHSTSYVLNFTRKTVWATFCAIFSQTNLVSLFRVDLSSWQNFRVKKIEKDKNGENETLAKNAKKMNGGHSGHELNKVGSR
jgi:hypothetical protein